MKFIIKLGFIFFVSWILYLIPSRFLPMDLFRIKEIKIQGNSKNLSSELTELASSLYNNNIWEIDLKEIQNFLAKDVRIKKTDVEVVSLGKLLINIEERKLKYYAQIGNKVYLVDDEGVIFGFLREKDELDTYFIKVEKEEDIKDLLKICRMIDENILKNLVSQIYKRDKNCVEIVLTDGTVIKTDFEVEKEKYKIVENLYYELIKTKKIEYIDLRFNDFIVKSLGDKSNGK
ncbi:MULTISPECIES: cell division protein FtsQ/DivIB [Fusobacterium]|uniref:FtsQ-type POTRA domain-containing protein n=1 Tax=Fusobacterium hominis TaxID=2764326 RepID=A0A7G9GVT5_9FUSO|nr:MULTISPECIES: cell division protein FtsQ/DivIB [Fusobacterium]QNM14917.1 FtsQ-type POTRA domain-containing protein [Fusobacterium hominis]